jgi:hypothetical protein
VRGVDPVANFLDCREDGLGEDFRDGDVRGEGLTGLLEDGPGPVAKSLNEKGTEIIIDFDFKWCFYVLADKLRNTCPDVRFVPRCTKIKSYLCHSSTSQSVQ